MKELRHRTTFSDLLVARSGLSIDGNHLFVTLKDGTGRPFKTHIRRVSRTREITEHNEAFGAKSKINADLWNRLNDNFKTDLGNYTRVFNSQHRRNLHSVSAFNLFVSVLSSVQTPVFSLVT